jgi:hypothetical protein
LTQAAWGALPPTEKDTLLAYETVYRQRQITSVREALKDKGAMDAAWLVLLILEQI